MNILVTAGNTFAPIDRVRGISNIFTGGTGGRIALWGHERGHAVALATSHPDVVTKLAGASGLPKERWTMHPYLTFDDLQEIMGRLLRSVAFDVVIHAAAVSDYQPAGIYAPGPHTRFHPEGGHWESLTAQPPALLDRAAEKVKSDEPELWLRLLRAPKLIDRVRTDWGFRGILVKFKLEVSVSDDELLEIAERSRRHSGADVMVANTLAGKDSVAFLGPIDERYQRVTREELARCLIARVEHLYKERCDG